MVQYDDGNGGKGRKRMDVVMLGEWRVESEGSGMEESVVRMKSGVCGSAMMESVWYKVRKYVNE